ncbi:MAG: FCD domain-containing protein [Phycisphaerae bacterium]|nr:FCD domain-containing protein [Phycisphaerae bacterium]
MSISLSAPDKMMRHSAGSFAAKRATEAQLTDLRRLAGEFSQCLKAPPLGRPSDDIEMDFHRTILEATQNKILVRMHHVLAAFFARSARENESWNVKCTTDKSVCEHKAIAAAICERNVEQARALLGVHLSVLISGHTCESDSISPD